MLWSFHIEKKKSYSFVRLFLCTERKMKDGRCNIENSKVREGKRDELSAADNGFMQILWKRRK